MTIKEMANGMV